ncbi:MAG: hypothetical protein KatS3mg008_2145 [Acidimicrobiales bacterium]|nr:MAG: hypothetical protein KatS3mg008_2145 [Acidimicrobiales bacterium]
MVTSLRLRLVETTSGAERGDATSTRRRLLEAAYELLVERGYERTTLQQVSQRAGLTTGAVYSNFANKLELMSEAVMDRWASEDLSQLFAPDPSGTIPALRLTEHLARHFARPPREEDKLVTEVTAASLRESQEDSPVRRRVFLLYELTKAAIAAARDQTVRRTELSDEVIALATVSFYLGCVTAKALGLPQPSESEALTYLNTVAAVY